jgi:hypothetical protein
MGLFRPSEATLDRSLQWMSGTCLDDDDNPHAERQHGALSYKGQVCTPVRVRKIETKVDPMDPFYRKIWEDLGGGEETVLLTAASPFLWYYTTTVSISLGL